MMISFKSPLADTLIIHFSFFILHYSFYTIYTARLEKTSRRAVCFLAAPAMQNAQLPPSVTFHTLSIGDLVIFYELSALYGRMLFVGIHF